MDIGVFMSNELFLLSPKNLLKKINGMGWWSTQMLPLEWIDLPVAVRFRRGQRKQKIEVAA